MPSPPLASLEERLGYSFTDKSLLEQALTHTSFANEQPEATPHNERLEFLGDSILDMVVSEHLVSAFPDVSEGDLSKLRAHLVNESALARRACALGLGEHLRLGRGEERTGGREKPSLLAGAFEALVAAVYLEAGHAQVWAVLLAQFAEALEELSVAGLEADYKSLLQERCQEMGHGLPSYTVVGESGPDHDKTFEVEVVAHEGLRGRGVGKTKKEAEQAAARKALERMKST